MRQQKNTRIFLLLLSVLSAGIFYMGLIRVSFSTDSLRTRVEFADSTSDIERPFRLYYSAAKDFSNAHFVHKNVFTTDSIIFAEFATPQGFLPQRLRLVFGNRHEVQISRIILKGSASDLEIPAADFERYFVPGNAGTRISFAGNRVLLQAEQGQLIIKTKDGIDLRADAADMLNRNEGLKAAWYAVLLAVLLYSILYFVLVVRMPYKPEDPVMPAKGRHSYGLIVLFLLILLLPFAYAYWPGGDKEDLEKRAKAKWPEWSLYAAPVYPQQLNTYFNDNFGGRKEIVEANAMIRVHLFGVSPNRDKVEIGKQGWLYFAEPDAREDYENRTPLTEDQLKRIRRNLVERAIWYERLHGAKYYVFFPLNKQTVYPEYLPASLKRYHSPSRLRQLITFLQQTTDLRIIDVEEDMLRAKKVAQIYYRRDTHWNRFGAYVGYRRLMERIHQDLPAVKAKLPLQDFRAFRSRGFRGDLDLYMGLPGITSEYNNDLVLKDPACARGRIPVELLAPENLANPDFYIRNVNRDTTLPSVYVERDSYGVSLLPFISQHFSVTNFVWNKSVEPALFLDARPDVVVTECLERFLLALDNESAPLVSKELRQHGIVVDETYFANGKARTR